MELANRHTEGTAVRVLGKRDRGAVTRLLQRAAVTHQHSDWFDLVDWYGTPGFVGVEAAGELVAFLVVGAAPPPAAWVRGAAFLQPEGVGRLAGTMLAAVVPFLRRQGVAELAWMPLSDWPAETMPALGFHPVTQVITMRKDNMRLPPITLSPRIQVRPARANDLAILAQIEAAAFAPIWRYSVEGLALAMRQVLSFHVALLDGQIVGYQCSTLGYSGAHLARMTVHPAAQRLGVGSALVVEAIEDYRLRGFRQVTLNTQVENLASQHLYRKFGFRPTGENLAVWSLPL